MKMQKNERGITLVALVVTIVVLLILAGITIMYVMSDNGVFGKAQQAKTETNKALVKDENSGIIQKLKFVALNNATTRAILTTKKQVENLRNSRETQKALLNVRGSIASNSLAVKTTEAVTQQINDLEVSEQQLIDNGLLEPTNVDKQKQIEEMLEKANSLYREGKAQDALDLYNQISLLNKELQGDKATVK